MSELVAPLIVLAVALLVGAAFSVVLLRRRRSGTAPAGARAGASARRAARTARPRPDRGTELARPEQLGIRTLTEAERERYRAAWAGLQSRAERLPALALSEADAVVDQALRDCGYPLDDPRAPSDVVPGRHAEVLASFRAGRALEQINSSSRSDPGQVQQAMAHFQAAFDAVVVTDGTPARPDAPRLLSAEPARAPRPHPGR